MKRTLSGELPPSTAPAIAGKDTEENPAAELQTQDVATKPTTPPATPAMHTPDTENGMLADWQAAAWQSDELPDLPILPQTMPHTPPVELPRLANAVEMESSEEDNHGNAYGLLPFEHAFEDLLDASRTGTKFSIIDLEIVAPTPSQQQALAQAIGRHTTLQTLELLSIRCDGLLAAVAEGMAMNQSIRTLNLGDTSIDGSICCDGYSVTCAAGSGVLLAQILTTNHGLKKLDISGCTGLTAKDYLDLFTALKENGTLESLHANQENPEALQIGPEAIDLLVLNRGLKMLALPWETMTREAFAAFGRLLKAHTRLAMIDLEGFRRDGSLAKALGQALKHGSRITTIGIDCLHLDDWHSWSPDEVPLRKALIAAVFEAIAQCPGVKSVHIGNLPYVDNLVDLLRANPGISKLSLSYPMAISVEKIEDVLQGLALFMQSANQISSFSYQQTFLEHFPRRSSIEKLYALALTNSLSHTQMASAGLGISVMLGMQRNEEGALPELPTDVTKQLAEAIVQNLRPADTRAVFAEVRPYGEVSPTNQERKM